MFTNLISKTITATEKTNAGTAINDIKLIFAWLLNLTPSDRKKLLKMGDKSVAFVRGVLAALKANPSVVGSSFDVAEFEKDVVLWDDMQAIFLLLRPLFEGFEDTMLALGNEMMQQANSGYKLLKEAAKTNSALTETVKDLGERYKKAGEIEPTAFTLPPKGKITLNGLVPGRQFKVISGGPLTLYKGNGVSGDGKLVGLANPTKLASGWNVTTIVSDVEIPTIFTIIQK